MEDKKIDISISEEIAEGIYSNGAVIAHSSSEFVIDFIRLMPGVAQAKVKSRVVLAPEHAKRLLLSLNENIRAYEKMFGSIDVLSPQQEILKTTITGKGEA